MLGFSFWMKWNGSNYNYQQNHYKSVPSRSCGRSGRISSKSAGHQFSWINTNACYMVKPGEILRRDRNLFFWWCQYLLLQASMNERKAKTESTRTGSSGSRIPEITQCNAFEKLVWSEKLMLAYCPATHAAYKEDGIWEISLTRCSIHVMNIIWVSCINI